jgi:hypothetical protein
MRWFAPGVLAVLVASIAVSALASPTTIGVFFDAAATDCDTSVDPFMPFTVYVSAVLGTDAAAEGITQAEFRVDGLTGIVLSVTPTPAADVALGNPTVGGGLVAFASCMAGQGLRHIVLLYTIVCSAPSPVLPRSVAVDRHPVPVDCWCPCRWGPCVGLCDYPVFTSMVVSGGHALINNGSCTVGLQSTAWSAVKLLWR